MEEHPISALQYAGNLLRSGDIQAAQSILVRYLNADPNCAQGWFLLSFTLQEADHKIYALRRSLHLNPEFKEAKERLAVLQKRGTESGLLVGQPKASIELLLSQAAILVEQGDFKAAKKILREFMKRHPNEIQGWFLLSFAEPTDRGKINVLRQALCLDPNFTDAKIRLAELQNQPARIISPASISAEPQRIDAKPAKPQQLKNSPGAFWNLTRYILRRGFMIVATIVIGIYLTVLITNKGDQIDRDVQQQINHRISMMRYSGEYQGMDRDEREAKLEVIKEELEEEAGLHLPKAARNFRWTYNALRFDWGKVLYLRHMSLSNTATEDLDQVNALILQYLPNTLMLFGVANLLVFLIGLPLALFLASRGKNSRFDRVMMMLSPLSSVPSWVHGILLVTIFAVVLGVLPSGGKYDNIPPSTQWGYIPVVAKHMILPVAAIFLSMIFQLIYSWRTYFLIYSDEDYVELALAKGLSPKTLERRYILRPTMPYIITGFALTLVGFWQMSTALETFFSWPGIGMLYVKALPNFWGESFFPGEVSIILSVVVLFALLLGFVVFVLDAAYAIIDPRVRVGVNHGGVVQTHSKRSRGRIWVHKRSPRRKNHWSSKKGFTPNSRPVSERIKITFGNLTMGLAQSWQWFKNLFREIRKYPSAVIGLSIIAIFVALSLYTVIALPYLEIGSEWRGSNISEKVYLPKNVPPEWTNWFRREKFPTTLVLNSQDETIQKTYNGSNEMIFTTTFDYPFTEFPQGLYLYINKTYREKQPFLSIKWITPDGREISPKSPTSETAVVYNFSENLNIRRPVRQNENWQNWFVTEGQNRTPEFYYLFADPDADNPQALSGTYRLEVSALTFEEGTDVEIEFVLFGQLHGWAGTDYLRRDLVVPLLWGLPFTLALGVFGAILTTTLAMIVAAAAVWFGGRFDGLIQRFTEANMILPVLAVGILVFAFYGISLWVIMGVIILLNVFGSPAKSFRAAFLQVKEAPYIEAARAYGASNSRIIFKYMIPKIIPVLIPQLVMLIPALVFLEATLGIFNVFDPRYPTWGRVIYEAVTRAALWGGSAYWVLEPISLLLLIGVSFAMVGFALERILNPRMQTK